MALKDWKKLKNLKKDTWESQKRGEWIWIEYNKRGVALTPYHVYTMRSGYLKREGFFKTKKQALAYAKSYMRKH